MRRLALLIGILLVCSVPLFAAITDSFTGADGSALSGGWAANEGTAWVISSNKAAPVSSGDSSMVRTEASFPSDQYVQLVTRELGGGSAAYGSALVRVVGSSYYECRILDGAVAIRKTVAGVDSYLNDAFTGIATPTTQTLKCVVTGTTIEAFINGVSKVTAIDSDIASGKPGMRQHDPGFAPTNSALIDDFESTDANVAPMRPCCLGVF